MNENFSVLIAVYKNDNPQDFRLAVESVTIKQTIKPNEVLVVVDGPIPQPLADVIRKLQSEIPYMTVEWRKENKGLGLALQYGMEHVSYELVARMDSDDIALPQRFEHQLELFFNDSELGVVGGQISEFIDTPDNFVGYRHVPLKNKDIHNYLKKRSGFNHMTVMFRKSNVLQAGNYQSSYFTEDIYLWLRMSLNGCKFANLDEVLVNVRVGKEMYARRGGWKYFKSEARLQKFRLKNGIISLPLYLLNMIVHFTVKCLMTNKVRTFFFQKILRRHSDSVVLI